MSLGAVLYSDVSTEPVHYVDRFEKVRHRGLRQAFEAINPGLLICHPDTFQIRYANEAGRKILGLESDHWPRRLPDIMTMTRQEEYCEAEGRYVACYNVKIDNDLNDVRALPVYDAAGKVESVMVVIRDYNDVSWSLFEMLDRLPIAVAAVNKETGNVRYVNRRALREIYSQRTQQRSKRCKTQTADQLIENTISSWLSHGPENGAGVAEVQVGKSRVDMHFADLGEDSTTLIYWDSRSHPQIS